MQISQLSSREVVVADRDASISDAAKLMRVFHTGDVVVVEERGGLRYPVGIVTDRDLVVAVLADAIERLDELTVADVMTRAVVTAPDSADISDVMSLMRSHRVRRIPIVGSHGELVGIVSFDDLVEHIAEQFGDLATLLAREHKHEKELAHLAMAGTTGTRH
ncbi:CBS domain-containing protein [Myxococcota bacterium]|nr:CBS domain-containing protein [Myxococcota bacterium]